VNPDILQLFIPPRTIRHIKQPGHGSRTVITRLFPGKGERQEIGYGQDAGRLLPYIGLMLAKPAYFCDRKLCIGNDAQQAAPCRRLSGRARGGVADMPFGIGNGKVLTGDMTNFWGRYPYDLDRDGQYEDASGAYVGGTTAVGAYSGYANAYGLYDMHGNVYEWCLDQWDDNSYAGSPVTDPVGTTGSTRVLRGGNWYYRALNCRSAYRFAYYPDDRYPFVGFRVVFCP
jgi:hypothetical protein